MIIFFFTATGNCLSAAKKILAAEDKGRLISIPQVIDTPNLEYEDDAIGIVFPIYGWGMPKQVKKFCETARLKANYIFAIGTYGKMPGACMTNVQKSAAKNGYKIDYAESLLMLDNYLPGFDMDKEIELLPEKNTERNLNRIIADISARKTRDAKSSLTWRAVTGIVQTGSGLMLDGTKARQYIVDDKCTSCGTCAKVCPTRNIIVTDKVEFADQCESCFACLHHCPKNALHLKNEKSAVRWRNPDVSLGDIIKANNREGI